MLQQPARSAPDTSCSCLEVSRATLDYDRAPNSEIPLQLLPGCSSMVPLPCFFKGLGV